MPRTWDLIVVGAGPAGSCAALAALRCRPGARVLILDAAPAGRDKTCGDGIAPEAVELAIELGVPAAGADGLLTGCTPIPRLGLTAPGGTTATAAFDRPSWVVPRRLFDLRLLRAALAAGAELGHERVRHLRIRADGCEVGRHLARVVVGADGAHSTVRRALAIPPNPRWATALAVRGYAASTGPGGPDTQVVSMVREGWPAYAWSFPCPPPRPAWWDMVPTSASAPISTACRPASPAICTAALPS